MCASADVAALASCHVDVAFVAGLNENLCSVLLALSFLAGGGDVCTSIRSWLHSSSYAHMPARVAADIPPPPRVEIFRCPLGSSAVVVVLLGMFLLTPCMCSHASAAVGATRVSWLLVLSRTWMSMEQRPRLAVHLAVSPTGYCYPWCTSSHLASCSPVAPLARLVRAFTTLVPSSFVSDLQLAARLHQSRAVFHTHSSSWTMHSCL